MTFAYNLRVTLRVTSFGKLTKKKIPHFAFPSGAASFYLRLASMFPGNVMVDATIDSFKTAYHDGDTPLQKDLTRIGQKICIQLP